MVDKTSFITKYKFDKDQSRPGRTVKSVCVGGVYISRVSIDPHRVAGNIYYEQTNIIFFVERRRLKMKCIQINTGEEKEMVIEAGDGVIHIPQYTAFAFKNIEDESCVLIIMSNRPLRSGDGRDLIIYQDKLRDV